MIDAGAGRHRGGDPDDLVVAFGFLDETFAENLLIRRRVRLGLGLRTGDDIKGDDAVILVGGGFRRRVALALLGDDMDEHGARLHVADVLQNRQKVIEIVAVDRPDIIEAEFFEQRARTVAGDKGAAVFLGLLGLFVDRLGQMLRELLGGLADRGVRTRSELGEIGRHGADRRRDRHVVVVQDDDQARLQRAGIVHRLVGHAGRHGAVADHRDDVVVVVRKVAGDRHAETGRDRGRRMRSAERVVFAFRTLGEAGKPAALPQRAHTVAAAGQDFVRVGLMPDIPDHPIMRRIEDVVECDGQLDDAKPGAKMAAGHGHGVDHLGAQFLGDLLEVRGRKGAQIGGHLDAVEKWGVG